MSEEEFLYDTEVEFWCDINMFHTICKGLDIYKANRSLILRTVINFFSSQSNLRLILRSLDGTRFKANSFLLSLLSPVLHKMICGSFVESSSKKIELHDVDYLIFSKVLDVWYGKQSLKSHTETTNIHELLQLGDLADRFQISEVVLAVEEAIIGQLGVDVCGDLLSCGGRAWLERAETMAWKLAAERFGELVTTAGFLRMPEEMVRGLLDEDGLGVATEEEAFEAAMVWMHAGDGCSLRGRDLLRSIRFPLMEAKGLGARLSGSLGALGDGVWVGAVVREAERARAAMKDGAGLDLLLLGPRAMTLRASPP